MASKTTFPVDPEQTTPPPPRRPPKGKREARLKLAKSLGDAAREARQKAGLTQADVAERIGVATEVYGRLERGILMPSVPTLRRICVALHMSADAMLALSSPQSQSPVLEPVPPPPVEPEEERIMRRLMRNVRKLNPIQIRALSMMASTLRRDE
ncbi:helix-turn-helix domain-containing protein [Archangium gephyra]|uniref:helix-turn-helix domain-containing protein n=1 Tax=Archangium gephyra TaxID=48 RepID=UPI003B81EEF3